MPTLKPTVFADPVHKTSIAERIMNDAADLAARATALASMTHNKLQPIMREQAPCPDEKNHKGEMAESYPTLFAALRADFEIITEALESIENAISRAAL